MSQPLVLNSNPSCTLARPPAPPPTNTLTTTPSILNPPDSEVHAPQVQGIFSTETLRVHIFRADLLNVFAPLLNRKLLQVRKLRWTFSPTAWSVHFGFGRNLRVRESPS